MVMRLLSPQFLVLWAFIGSTFAVHFRGRVRLGFWRQLSDHSTLMAPYNVLMYMFSAVPNRPILDVGMVPELLILRQNWQIIREEAQQLFAQGAIKAADRYNDWGFNSFFRTGWKRFYLKWYEEPLPSALANCPKTVALLDAIPIIKGAMFANLPPGGRLVQHRDPYAGSLRYHLGLQVPTSPGECRIFIDGEPYVWHDGEDLLFDETYLHYAENTTGDDRLILFCDVERPLKTRAMISVNRWVSRHIISESATQNVEGERVGWINRVFAYAYQVRLLGKRMKAWNRRVYYVVKYLLIGGVIAAFLATAFA
ncbi:MULTISPECIES: aspartyl/asparaginyl beta-hydroxylase domain-containing protein [Bradyrhizobium]|uniref:aspartyl/asparaginyl beta-hydroxylase domain-containing protein n=1 Tax=Bradyrhizobium TaxID=374 RepID=UPI001EDA2EF9|nr:aspartyl/asparaginyl beta-hydroxylase domain-containing protein [Bradyrhizobium zhengyangense]MCG2644341.1 aspartyl/asparaginyl beta-hydroxylase domain-containing protein [Bradyrhizobium zhengyangense]